MTENMVTIPIWLAVILITVLAGALGWVLRTVFQVLKDHDKRLTEVETVIIEREKVSAQQWGRVEKVLDQIWHEINELRKQA